MRYTDTSLSPNETLQPTAAGMPPGPGLVTTCCISGTPFLLEGGLGLSDRMLVGGLLQFHAATESVSTTTPRARELMWSLAPKVDYQLFPSLRFNPFIGITASVAHLTRNYNEIEDTRLSYGFYARAGTRYFVLEELSIDSALAIGGYFGSGSQASDRTPGLEQDYDVSGFDVSLALAISVWLR